MIGNVKLAKVVLKNLYQITEPVPVISLFVQVNAIHPFIKMISVTLFLVF